MDIYGYNSSQPLHSTNYLWPHLKKIVDSRTWTDRRAFDLGCGNGAICRRLEGEGFKATGIDISEEGVGIGRASGLNLHVGSAYDDLAATYGKFPLVLSLEVVQSLTDPKAFAKNFLNLIEPGGIGIVATQYHGYIKNVALAVSGKMDAHFTALWDVGHIKFFSEKTFSQLLRDAGAKKVSFRRAGRIPVIAKSMIATVEI